MSQPTERLLAWGTEPPLWVRLLDAEVARSNMTAAAKRIGMNRATVSTVLRNCYPSLSTAGVERRVMDALGRLECPALEATITVVQCQAFREKPAPTHNPLAMQHWKACQHCPHNPSCQAQESHHANRR
ncbi:hypothetical protein PSCT_01189 [Pseudomonas sp. SCT]|uniref:hypothetical protein n=1 Tax=Pseudomonas sp. (strain SCT) TaxID=412955 RepID=UPI000EC19B84|nr:hypothetical protein [Pseudomonas sp. SCT]GCA55008.1 hypothetical protein PSCT_01189 [Pseudomonas sp. SCT]